MNGYSGIRLWIYALCVLACLTSFCQTQAAPESGQAVANEFSSLQQEIESQLATQRESLDSVSEQYGGGSKDWWQVYRELDPLTNLGVEIVEFAKSYPDSPLAICCLSYVIDMGEGEPSDVSKLAFNELLASHKNKPEMSWLASRCTNALFFESVEPFLSQLLADSENPTVRGCAAYNLARLYDNIICTKDSLTQRRQKFDDGGLAQYVENLDRLDRLDRQYLISRRSVLIDLVLREYSDARCVSAPRISGVLEYEFKSLLPESPTLGDLTKGLSFEISNLRVGCVAPDFNGKLVDGQPFHLRKHGEGPKLIIFSFKGCGACEAKYPLLREVQECYSKQGFSVLGIMGDKSIDTVQEAVETGKITWPCIWDGRDGPISKLYHVAHHPTVYLLNKNCQIVAMEIENEQLLHGAIDALLEAN